jgi:hypothetical protein
MTGHQKKEILQYAPYPIGIYRSLLFMMHNSAEYYSRSYVPLKEKRIDKINVFFRQDIDTARCIENMDMLVEAHKEFQIPSNIYFRVDDKEYRLRDYRERILEYRNEGFETGLHTVCYLADDYMKDFEKETEKFADELGFRPKSFTIHGLGEYRLDVRRAFIENIIKSFDRYGYLFSDCHPSFIRIDAFHEDCNMDEDKKMRFITPQFISPPGYLNPGMSCLVLTHPIYWKKENNFREFLVSWEQIPGRSKICIYGTGKGADIFEKSLDIYRNDIEIVCYIDTFRKGQRNGRDIILPAELPGYQGKYDSIIVTSSAWEEIQDTLKTLKITNYLICRIPFY